MEKNNEYQRILLDRYILEVFHEFGLQPVVFEIAINRCSEDSESKIDQRPTIEKEEVTYEYTEKTEVKEPVKNDSPWYEISQWQGKSIKNTETFHIPSHEWKISWKTEPGEYGDMNFQIYVYEASSSFPEVLANVIGYDVDSSIMRGAGDYYLKINSGQPYRIIVEAKHEQNAEVKHAKRSYKINDYQGQMKILENGDIWVSEIFEYSFEGDFSGIIRDIGIKGSDGIQNFRTSEYYPTDKELDYERSIKGNTISYRIYDKSSNEKKLFLLEYLLKNVITVYNDTAEFYWKFFDETNVSPIGHVKVEVEFSKEVSEEELRAFGHGPLHGKVSIQENGKVKYEVFRFSSGEMVEARILFPTSMVPDSNKIIKENKFKVIMNEELKWENLK